MPIKNLDPRRTLVSTYVIVLQNQAMQPVTVRYSCYFLLAVLLSAVLGLAVVTSRGFQIVNQHWTLLGHLFSGYLVRMFERTGWPEGLHPGRTLLFLGAVSILWTASSGFVAMIEALNIAYDVGDERQFWHTRCLAVALVLSTGILLLTSLGVAVAGPYFGEWSAQQFHVPGWLVLVWPYIYWVLPVLLALAAVETLYFIGPNVKQRFRATLPGLSLAAICCLGLSGVMEVCSRRVGALGSGYVSAGAAVALMAAWVYCTGIAVVLGAALNAELSKLSDEGKLQEKSSASRYIKLNLAA
jgi:membrane protein